MREHLPDGQRTHWVTTEGGEAPNVVPDRASTWYFARNLDERVEDHFQWILDCAKGAALMTRTTYEVRVSTAIHQRFYNRALAELIFENIKAVGKPEYTKEEEAYARALQESAGLPVVGMEYALGVSSPGATPYTGGSSDVGDVTLVAPTAGFRFPVGVPGAVPHTWVVASSGPTSIAHKGITTGAKVSAFSAYDLITRGDSLTQVRAEFEEMARIRPYKSFLPDEALPPLGWNRALMEKYREAMEPFYLHPSP
jgi:aminobenzoyl-glutamate utilization protein B